MDAEVKLPECYSMDQLKGIRDAINLAPSSQRNVLLNIGMLACSGINSHHVVRIVPMLLRKIMPIDIAGFFWSNETGDMIDAYVETPYFLSAEVLLSCLKFQSEAAGNWPSFTENVMQGPVVGYLQSYQTPYFYQSEHYKITYERINMHHITDAVVHDWSRPYGSYLLMRNQEKGKFTSDELQTLSIAMSLLSDAFSAMGQHRVPTKRTYDLGIVVVDKELIRKFCNITAHQILWMMTRNSEVAMQFGTNDDLDSLIKMTCKHGVEAAIQHGNFVETKYCHWGEFLIKYIYDNEAETIAVNFQQMQPYPCHIAIRLNQTSLTPTQMMIAWLLLNGFVRKEIANKLQISEATTAEHIHEIYYYFNVDSINALLLEIYR